jgi:GPH family glycoside/pentoside/hexuronide:cation symporter
MVVSSYYIKEYKFAQLEEPLGVIPALKESFKNKPFIIFELSLFCIILGQTMLTTAVFYYVDFVLNLSGVMSIVPIIIVIGVMFAFAYPASKLIEKYGLKKVFIFGQITLGIGFVLTFFIGWSLNTVIISMVLIGIGLSILFMESPIILADTIDFDELKTDKRRETTYTGIEALITKPAISLGNWLFLVIISGYGFQEAAKTQPDSAILGIMIGFTIIPAIFIFLSALIMKFYTLDGPEWTEQKLKLQGIHEKKEIEYLQHLKEQGKL